MAEYYDWDKILKSFSDEELYKALYESDSPDEKKKTAEKLLLAQGLIIKTETGKYARVVVESKYLNFIAYNLRSKSDIDTILELINRGLNEATAVRLVDYYQNWKIRQKKKQKIWYIITPISVLVGLFIEIKFDSYFGMLFYIIPCAILAYNSPSIINFKRLKFLKVINTPQ